jgi:hypothetical protein
MTFDDLRFQSIVFYFAIFLCLCKCFFYYYYALGLDSYLVIGESHFDLNVVYNLRYFYVMCCMCDDNDSCRCQHRSIGH